ncbi:cytochrome P450 [Pseudonocardia sp. HH130630-07]|uniref:cytochrome P450 n=1 Tax=Pseudonocardia sp. HH130630-07 TaxID=1690815 RepID=UPI000814FCFA|nr:cytochrome P450 [Pseudonocardia sp. HH130630-07]ANY10013.1 cytochrome [Pseudonocardia sp. HH130630-07]
MTDAIAEPDTVFPRERGCPFAARAQDAEMRAISPVREVTLQGGESAWWVTGHEEGRTVLSDRRFSSDRRLPRFPLPGGDAETRERFRSQPPSMIGMDGEEHSRARRAVLGEFTVRRLQALRPRIQEIVDGFVDEMLAAEEHPVDLVQALSLPVPSLVICEMLGVPYADHDFFQARTATLIRRSSPPGDKARALDELRGYLGELLTRKDAEPTDDLLGRQVAAQRAAGTLDREGLVSTAFLLLAAGHETTANMISLGTLTLLRDDGQRAALAADPDAIPAAIEELLRWFSIVETATSRVATADVELAGRTIRAGEGVVVSGLAANRDPRAFDGPEDLDLTRGSRRHLAFGYGPHQCLGQNLARLELEVVFETLLRRIPGLRLAAQPDEIDFKDDAAIFGAWQLPVTW